MIGVQQDVYICLTAQWERADEVVVDDDDAGGSNIWQPTRAFVKAGGRLQVYPLK